MREQWNDRKGSGTLPSGVLTIRAKILLFSVVIGVLILATLGIVAYTLSANALRRVRLDGFQSLRTSLSQNIQTFILNQRRENAAQSDVQTFRYAVSELSGGYRNLVKELESTGFQLNDQFLRMIHEDLRHVYEARPMAALKEIGMATGSFDEFAGLSREAAILQYVYIVKNPVSTGGRSYTSSTDEISNSENLPPDFRMAFAKTTFARAMERYQPLFETLGRRSKYFDLVLIDDQGNVVYTFDQTWDFGTNVLTGWRNHSNLKKIFLGAWYAPTEKGDLTSGDQVLVTDLERYPAAYGAPMMFLGSTINNRLGGRLGAIIHKISGSAFTEMVTFDRRWEAVGLGKTGEAYIVGPDRRLRTESRFVTELPAKMVSSSFSLNGVKGPPTAILGPVLQNRAVENLYSSDLLANAGTVTFYDDLGREALGVFAPLQIPGLDWGLVVKISTDEAFAPAAQLNRLIAVAGVIILSLAVLGALWFGYFLARPIGELVTTAEKIGAGDHTARASVSSRDEIGFLAERFNSMIDQVEERNQHLRKILQTVKEGLFLMGPDLVIQPGYSRATEEIFRRKIEGMNFLDLFGTDTISPHTLSATRHYLELLLDPRIKEKLIQQTNPLSEVEYRIIDQQGSTHTKFLELRFNRVVEAGKTVQIMVTVVDATSRIALGKQIRENEARARSQIEMLFGILHVEPSLLAEFLRTADVEISGMLGLLEAQHYESDGAESNTERSNRYTELLNKISRSIHLIKGNAGMLRLSYFESLANQLEERLAALRGRQNLSGEQFLPITSGLASLLEQTKMAEELLTRLFSKEAVQTEGQIDFRPLADLAKEIAHRTGKKVRVEVNIPREVGQLSDRLREPVQASLVQLVRNAVTHGIETPAERLVRRKDATGVIQILGGWDNGRGGRRLWFTVRDDGHGISYRVLKERAVQLGYASMKTIESWTERQLIELLFDPGFTTMDSPTMDGGRGIGLDAVRDLVRRAGGSLRLSAEEGKFCQVRLDIPTT
jgi:HAMP domain-containing protein/HPt (histidine-containing phosphotransfer) domain-containing protein